MQCPFFIISAIMATAVHTTVEDRHMPELLGYIRHYQHSQDEMLRFIHSHMGHASLTGKQYNTLFPPTILPLIMPMQNTTLTEGENITDPAACSVGCPVRTGDIAQNIGVIQEQCAEKGTLVAEVTYPDHATVRLCTDFEWTTPPEKADVKNVRLVITSTHLILSNIRQI